MIVCYPRYNPDQEHTYRPWLSRLIALLVLCLGAGQWWYLSLPLWMQDVISWLSAGRLYVDPSQSFFQPLQIWTSVFFHSGWWQLLPVIVVWLAISSELERRWGSFRLLFLYVVIAPISASLLLIARSDHPGFGLVPLIMAAAGALNAVKPEQRLHWGLWYLLPWLVGWRRLSVHLFVVVSIWLGYEVIRVTIVQREVMPMLLSLSVMFLSASTSYLLASLLFLPKSDGQLAQIIAVAEGREPLDLLDVLLPKSKDISVETMAKITQRCIAEQRYDIAQLVTTYLALRDPDHPSYVVLRNFLNKTTDVPQSGA